MTLEKTFFKEEKSPNLLKLLQHILSIPLSNASVECVFSVIGNIWTDDRNKLIVVTGHRKLTSSFIYECNSSQISTAESLLKQFTKDMYAWGDIVRVG